MILFWMRSYIIWQSLRSLKFMVTCKRRDSFIRLVCSGASNSILDSSARWWKDGGPRHALFIFHVTSLQSHWWTWHYNSFCRWMGQLSREL
ncbi:hypothetical protein Goarm_001283 [Gossypium armourianum]|uniref:Uncharacterized protein n=1 Tax=Gossypium armourianum TaxID=34283 RepID=A0A7J9KCP6_9ROSI|nr:hypothetical protein [Gossypium armourianum]